ncbi:MAG: hypothetical protein JWN50_447 [Parcubacteria group bacterium]|nr:hypothetical protein [Parcubacteria group bacterium]
MITATTVERYEIGLPVEQGIFRQMLLERGFNLLNSDSRVVYFEKSGRHFIIDFAHWITESEWAEFDKEFEQRLRRA